MTFVPYVEALAFWGLAVQHGTAPRTYAIGVLLEHSLITDYTSGSLQEKAAAVAADVDQWEDRVVEMLFDPDEDLHDRLRRCERPRADSPLNDHTP